MNTCVECHCDAKDKVIHDYCGLCVGCFELRIELDRFEIMMQRYDEMMEQLKGVGEEIKQLLKQSYMFSKECPF